MNCCLAVLASENNRLSSSSDRSDSYSRLAFSPTAVADANAASSPAPVPAEASAFSTPRRRIFIIVKLDWMTLLSATTDGSKFDDTTTTLRLMSRIRHSDTPPRSRENSIRATKPRVIRPGRERGSIGVESLLRG